VHIVGRNDDVIISGGEKISTTRVAEFLQSAFPNIEVYAVGVPDEQWGQSLRIVIVNSEQRKQITLGELRSLVAESIGRAAAPGSLLLLDEMPLKANGKIDFAFLIGAAATEIYQG
jgi:acyl-CoA synthetase (AMP-forming)/AMP-acid ligase II